MQHLAGMRQWNLLHPSPAVLDPGREKGHLVTLQSLLCLRYPSPPSPGSLKTHPVLPIEGTGECGQITQLTALSRELQTGHPCCPGGEGQGHQCHWLPPWSGRLRSGLPRRLAHTYDTVHTLHRTHLRSSPPGYLYSIDLISVLI